MANAITLTANLQDFTSASEAGSLIITLCNFGSGVPRIAGTSMLADAGPTKIAAVNGAVNTTLWGNDVITPNSTYYCVQVADDNSDVVQCGNYLFTGSGPIDLSTAPPIDPNIGTPPFQFATSDVFVIAPGLAGQQEPQAFAALLKMLSDAGLDVRPPVGPAPTRTTSFSATPGTTYTLTYTPALSFLLGFYYNGTLLIPGLHYTLNGRTITLTFSTRVGDNLCAVYVASN